MIRILFLLFFLNSVQVHSQKDWQNGFGLTHNIEKDSIWNKPVSYYFSKSKCNVIAKEFYYGNYRPTDEEKTDTLLHLALTKDAKLRPFYRWILNQTIEIQDGALAEHTGIPARRYVEQYPKEFIDFIETSNSKNSYLDWAESISYSGFYDSDDYKHPITIRQKMLDTILLNCEKCSAEDLSRLTEFISKCFVDQ